MEGRASIPKPSNTQQSGGGFPDVKLTEATSGGCLEVTCIAHMLDESKGGRGSREGQLHESSYSEIIHPQVWLPRELYVLEADGHAVFVSSPAFSICVMNTQQEAQGTACQESPCPVCLRSVPRTTAHTCYSRSKRCHQRAGTQPRA